MWFFRDGTPVNPNWKITKVNSDKGTALAVSPMSGKQPRVWTMTALERLNAESDKRANDRFEKSLNDTLNSVPLLSDALTRVFFFKMGGVNKEFPWLQNKLSKILDVADNKWSWSEKRAEYLISLVEEYEDTLSRLTAQKENHENLRNNPELHVKSGKQTIVGEIYRIKILPNPYSHSEITVKKILVRNELSQSFYGTLPENVCNAKEGDTIHMDATVVPDKHDPLFAYFRRPFNAKLNLKNS